MLKLNVKKCLIGLLASWMTFTAVPAFVQADTDKDAIILYTNDIHCAIDDYSELAAYAAQLEADGQEVLIVDSGDHIQGEAIGTLTEGDALVDIMNTVGYDYAIPGNHEFDYSMEKFLEIKDEMSDYTYLSSNFIDLRTGSRVLKAYDIVEVNGEKIAFVGVSTPETLTSTTISYFQDEDGNFIYDFSQADFYAVVQSAVDAARADGAQRVIMLGHLGVTGTTAGWKSTDVIANTTGIDVFLDGHSEEVIHGDVYKNKNGEDVLLSSTGRKFAYFGKLTLDDEDVEKTELIDPETVNENSSEAAKAAYDKVQAKIDDYNAQMDFLYEVIGTSEVELVESSGGVRIVRKQETNAGDFVTDAYRAVTGAEIALCNSGGVRANLAAGDVNRELLMAMNPWSNAMRVAKVTGQQILDALEYGARMYPELNGSFLQVSGLTYEVHAYNESPVIMNSDNTCAGIDNTKPRRVTNVTVNGEPLDKDRLYSVAATEYIFENHGDGFMMLKDCEIVASEGLPTDAEMLVQYLTEKLNGTITKTQYGSVNGEGRIKIYASEEEIYHYLKVEGTSVNASNAADILGDGTVSYDLETNTLTLNNADLYTTKASKNYPVYAKGDLNIVLKGENKLSSDYFYGLAIVDPANKDSVKVTISGDGSLDSYGTDGGILIRGSLTINGNADVTGRCGDVTSGSAYGIRAYDDIEVSGNAKVTTKAGSAPENSYGIYAGDNFTASGDAQVVAEAGKGAKRSAGLYAISNIYVKDNAQVETTGVDNSDLEKFASESYGIRTTHMYISGGSLTATGHGATEAGVSIGIFTQDFELTGGTVNAKSEDPKAARSVGLQATKTLKVVDGTLNAVSGDATSDSYAIDASGELDVSGGTVNATTGTGDYSHGIDSDKVNITGGVVNVSIEGGISQARGIRSNNEIKISDGKVFVAVGDAGERNFGIQAGAPVSITGGKVFVECGEGTGSAIYGWDDMLITDAEVSVKSKDKGIHAPGGSLNIDCTDVTISETGPYLVGTRVTVEADGEDLVAENGVSISDKLVSNVTEKTEIEPLGYSVLIKGLSYDMSVLVPAGKSVNEVYCKNIGVNDFAEAVDTTKEGYTFEGFYSDEACTAGKEYSFDSVVTGNVTVYTKWVVVPQEPGDTEKPGGTEKPENTQKPSDKEDNDGVNTGDQAQIGLWMSLSVAMLAVIAVLKKRIWKNNI